MTYYTGSKFLHETRTLPRHTERQLVIEHRLSLTFHVCRHPARRYCYAPPSPLPPRPPPLNASRYFLPIFVLAHSTNVLSSATARVLIFFCNVVVLLQPITVTSLVGVSRYLYRYLRQHRQPKPRTCGWATFRCSRFEDILFSNFDVAPYALSCDSRGMPGFCSTRSVGRLPYAPHHLDVNLPVSST